MADDDITKNFDPGGSGSLVGVAFQLEKIAMLPTFSREVARLSQNLTGRYLGRYFECLRHSKIISLQHRFESWARNP